MSKIYEHDGLYSFLRPYVDYSVKSSYSQVEVTGEENIPTDGAVILAPNHCNTLMDALVVLRANKDATVFGARADVFNKPFVAKIMKFLRILPMVRKRDGMRNVLKNHDSIDQIIETLENGVRYCMFCEGTHRTKHSVMPVTKGIVRIALAANEKFGDQKPVYIVPVGLEYGDYFRFKATSLLQYGKPINITEFVRTHQDTNEADIYRELTWKIRDEISNLITFIPDNELYSPKWTLTKVWAERKGSPKKQFEANRIAAAKTENASEELLAAADAFDAARIARCVSMKSFGWKCMWARILWKTFAFLALLPIFCYCTVAALPIWATSKAIEKNVKDPAFRNTVRFGVQTAMLPLLLIIYGVLLFIFLPWYVALACLALAFFANGVYYLYMENFRIYCSDWRLAASKSLQKMYWDLRAAEPEV